MAWSNPSTRSAGYVVPHTVWNSDVVDNPTALRGGAIAISGQAQHQLIVASSASQFGVVTVPSRGAMLYAGASGAPGWLAAGTSGYVLTAQGAGADPVWAANTTTPSLARDVAEQEVVSSASETTVFTTTVSGGSLSTNKMIRVTLMGDLLNNSGGNRTLRLRLKYGSTTIFDSTAITVGSGATRGGVSLHAELSARGATNEQVCIGRAWVGQGSGVAGSAQTIAAGSGQLFHGQHNAIAEDSTGDLALAITAQLSASEATLSFVAQTVQVELI